MTLRFIMPFLTSFAKISHASLNLYDQADLQNVPSPEINVSLLLKNLSFLKLMTVKEE